MDLVERLGKLRVGRIAMHIHLSRLPPAYQRERYIRIATETFIASIRAFEGQFFNLANSDLVFIARNATVTMLDAAVNRLRVLFSEDPLVLEDLCSWYMLESDYDAFHEAMRKLLDESEQARQNPHGINPASQLTPVRPESVARLEQSLAQADVTNVVRRQIICTLIENTQPQPLFEEIFVSIEDLQKTATPGVDLLADRWLFQYLTQTLDKRVMMMLMRDGINTTRPFSINLNIATLLSPEFARFEAIIAPQLRGRLVIEMNKLDVFGDMGAFLFARDYLHDHGFRICLDGMTHHTLPYYDRASLGFDLVKLLWTSDGLDIMLPERVPELRKIVMETGQARTILCRCDNEHAVQVGQSLGIVMFQGRYIDRLLEAAQINAPPSVWAGFGE